MAPKQLSSPRVIFRDAVLPHQSPFVCGDTVRSGGRVCLGDAAGGVSCMALLLGWGVLGPWELHPGASRGKYTSGVVVVLWTVGHTWCCCCPLSAGCGHGR